MDTTTPARTHSTLKPARSRWAITAVRVFSTPFCTFNPLAARRLTEADAAQVCALMQGNPLFYRYHPPQPTPESIRTDMTALPPGKAMEDKWFVGFYDGDCLIAVMDLILNYPAADTAFIGLFMTAHDRQGCGLGSRILRDCIARLAAAGYHRLRLAVDEGNPQSLAFWTKNGFVLTGEVHPNDFSAYLPMERSI